MFQINGELKEGMEHSLRPVSEADLGMNEVSSQALGLHSCTDVQMARRCAGEGTLGYDDL